jgi:hypothetical protein
VTEVWDALSEIGVALDRVEATLLRFRPPAMTTEVRAALAAVEAAVDRASTTISSSRATSARVAFQELEHIDCLRDQMDVVEALVEEALR